MHESSEQAVIELKQEHDALRAEVRELHDLLKSRKDSPSERTIECIVTKQEAEAAEHKSSTSSESESESTDSTICRRTSTRVQRGSAGRPHPWVSERCPVAWRSSQASEQRTERSRCGLMILRQPQKTVDGLIT